MGNIDDTVYIADSADVVGDVSIGKDSSVWNHATVRGDRAFVSIGEGSNVQDNAVLHVETGLPVVVGDYVTIGHSAIVHGCSVGDHTLVGMGAIIMNGAKVGKDCVIGAGAVVTENAVIPDGSLAVGLPAKVIKQVSEEQKKEFKKNALEYVEEAKAYKAKQR